MDRMEEPWKGGHTSFARGGPLYIPNLVGPLTSVPEFEASVLQELQSLQAELLEVADFGDELSIDELLVFTEEELVQKALEALEDTEDGGELVPAMKKCYFQMECTASNMSGEQIIPMTISANEGSGADARMSSNCNSLELHQEDASQHTKNKSKKRGRLFDRDTRASELNSINFKKVENFVKIKQNQHKDRTAARLHSFNGSSKVASGMQSTSEKTGKLQSLRFITSPLKVKSLNVYQHVPNCHLGVILCVEVYDNRLSSKKIQELLVLGTQKLSALRDHIYCSTDKLMWAAGQHDPSGYFLVENVFLNDMRDPLAVDYSKPIYDWLENCPEEAKEKWESIVSGESKRHRRILGNLISTDLPRFKAIDMHKTRFCDLIFHPGSGYLYCHQGDCKHVVVIRDMRLIHPEDDQNEEAYPLVLFQHRMLRRKCSVCKINMSVMMTVDDKWSAKNPCYFCKDCYYLLHYKEDNSLLYNDFSVYDLESCWPMSTFMDKAQHRTPDA